MYTIPWQLISPWHLGVPWVAAPDLWPPRAPPGNWGAAATGSDGGSMYGIYTNIGGILMVNVTIYIYIAYMDPMGDEKSGFTTVLDPPSA